MELQLLITRQLPPCSRPIIQNDMSFLPKKYWYGSIFYYFINTIIFMGSNTAVTQLTTSYKGVLLVLIDLVTMEANVD